VRFSIAAVRGLGRSPHWMRFSTVKVPLPKQPLRARGVTIADPLQRNG